VGGQERSGRRPLADTRGSGSALRAALCHLSRALLGSGFCTVIITSPFAPALVSQGSRQCALKLPIQGRLSLVFSENDKRHGHTEFLTRAVCGSSGQWAVGGRNQTPDWIQSGYVQRTTDQADGKNEGKMFARKHWFLRGFGRRTFPSNPGCQRAIVPGTKMRFLSKKTRKMKIDLNQRGKHAWCSIEIPRQFRRFGAGRSFP
jgi:hypothetical protein